MRILPNTWIAGFRSYEPTGDGQHFIMAFPAGQLPSETHATPQINVILNWFEELKQGVPVK